MILVWVSGYGTISVVQFLSPFCHKAILTKLIRYEMRVTAEKSVKIFILSMSYLGYLLLDKKDQYVLKKTHENHTHRQIDLRNAG